MNWTSRIVSVVFLALCLQVPAWAEDIFPPSWRGDPGTTWAQYEFLAEGIPNGNGGFIYDTPDLGYLPVGPALLTHIPGPGAGWSPQQPTWMLGGIGLYDPAGDPGDGWVNLSGEIIVTLENFDNNNPSKDIWIQMVWEPQAYGSKPTIQITDPSGGDPTSIPLVRTELWPDEGPPDPTNPWRAVYHDVYHLQLFPNPARETILIIGGINVDELVIDTRCVGVPEPSTLVLLGVGAFGILVHTLRRRR